MSKKKFFLVLFLAIFSFQLFPVLWSWITGNPCPIRFGSESELYPDRLAVNDAGKTFAVSQWSRKYKTACSTCHTAIPRLNYYGERFMRNGFQDPDADALDGGTLNKEQYNGVDVGRVEDLFGFRVSAIPFKLTTNGLTENGSTKTAIDLGTVQWIQLFTAGTVTKNVSFFNELELDRDGKVKYGWFYIGAHNVMDSHGLVNFQIGKLSPVEWTSYSGRLSIFPELKGFADKIKSSTNGSATNIGEDSADTSSAQYGIAYYGYRGPLVWSLGGGNSANPVDVNQEKNFWSSVRLEMPQGNSAIEGSSVSLFYYNGTDTFSTATAQVTNDYWRIQPSANLRYQNFDVIGSFQYAKEDNFTLATPAGEESYWGITGVASYMPLTWLMTGVEYDTVQQDTGANLENDRVAFHVSLLPRENIRLIFTADTDLFKSGTKKHEFYSVIRMMF